MVSERDFQNTVIELAKLNGWLVHAERHAMKKDGSWITPIQGDAGFVDLVLVRDRVIFAELKSEKGKVSDAQWGWIDALRMVGKEVYIWRPSDWDEIVEILKR